MHPMDVAGRRPFTNLAAAGLAVAAIALAAAPVATADAVPSSEGEVTSPVAPEVPATSQMTVRFPSHTARVSGPGALVSVRCTGSADRECTGTLTLEGLSESHSVSYAVGRGERRQLVVPLGAERSFFDGIASPKMRVVAETMQPTGSSVRTARLLRFR
jgi:hypothetical protein